MNFQLTEIATGLGITDEQIADSGESWQGVVDLIEAAQGADGGDDSGTDTEAAADDGSDQTLGELADAGDADAIANLTAQAEAAGIDINDYGPWVDLEAALPEVIDGTDEAPAEEPWKPAVKDVYNYFPLDQKTKKKGKTKIEVEVMSVFPATETVNLRSNIDKETLYKSVPWTDLAQ